MPDLHGWITQQVDAAEAYALDHILNPANALRRCEADRKILARHRLNPDVHFEPACLGCGTYGDMELSETDNLNECPELLDLAHAHGLTPEILATLDRPKEGERPEPTRPSLIPDTLAEALRGQLLATFLGTRPVEPRPEVKALKILDSELKKIPGYVPIAEDPEPA